MGKLWVLAALVALQPAGVDVSPADRALLQASDLSALAPDVFTARLVLTGPDGVPHAVDVWRAGADRLLVRTSCGTDRPEPRMSRFRADTSSASTSA